MEALNIILGGSLVITLWGAYQLHKRVEDLDRYATVVTRFAREISKYSAEETDVKFKRFVRKTFKEMAEE
jgi:hypothetical protein